MRILVTGANGYLGQGIVSSLLDRGHEVIAASFRTDRVDERAERIEGDIFAAEAPFERYERPEALVHLAWKNGFAHNSDTHLEDLPRHYRFLEKMVASGIKKVCVLGSMHEIGFYEGCISENTPCEPMSLYGISKNALRKAVELLAQKNGCLYQWLRGYYIVGNSEYGCSIFSKLTQAAQAGKREFPFTQGQNQFDFLPYELFCDYVAAAVGQNEINGVINICSGKPEKLADRVEQFIRDNRLDIALQYGAFPDRPYDSKAVWGSDQKIRQILAREREIQAPPRGQERICSFF